MQKRKNRIIVGSPLMTEDTNEERGTIEKQ